MSEMKKTGSTLATLPQRPESNKLVLISQLLSGRSRRACLVLHSGMVYDNRHVKFAAGMLEDLKALAKELGESAEQAASTAHASLAAPMRCCFLTSYALFGTYSSICITLLLLCFPVHPPTSYKLKSPLKCLLDSSAPCRP